MRRLREFRQRHGKLSKAVLVVGAVVLAGVCISALSSCSDAETTVVPETETTGSGSEPIRCLEAAGLSDVEEQDVDLWRGFHDGPSYAIIVRKLQTPAKAPTVVAGTYALTGPFKVAAEGTGLTSEEGLEADFLVREVAACLGG